MSCQLDVVSAIQDVAAIRYRLFPERSLEDDNDRATTVKDDDDWDGGNWSWKEDGDDDVGNDYAHSKPTPPNRFCWLQECVISVSPVGDVLVLARNRTIIWLNQKWDNDSSRQNFFKVRTEIIPSTSDDRVDDQDFVTAVLCLPLASQKRSAHGRQDWTAVLVGFNLGTVRVYTEDGTLLLVQRFDQSPIVSLKCRCFEPPRYNAMAEQHEELVVVYKKCVVVVQGLGLYQTLRACRNQAAKAAAAGGDPFEAPPLEYKKWALHDHNEVNDCESIGTVGTVTFDQMVSESVIRSSSILGAGLMVASRKASSSAASLFVATGTCPYVGFYYAVEGSAPLLVSEAMMAAAQKLSSYFTGFFVGGRTQVDKKQPPKLEPATSLPSRFELRDLRRTGLIICASPNRRLSAIADEFGRVVIVDNHEGIAVRIFKGYREAQCGWIEVEEERQTSDKHSVLNSPSPARIALFLVIYSRRRGILEVWAAQQGPRVAAFSVGKTSTLVYCNYSILGATNVKSVLNSWSQSTRCYLLDVDGVIRSITVPFHCALSSGGDLGKARDLHLLEKVRLEVDSWGRDQGGRRVAQVETPSKVVDIVLDMKTWTVRQQALELLLKSEDADSVVIDEVVSRLLADLQASNGDCETLQRLRRYLQLLRLHDAMVRLVGNSTSTRVENVDVDLQEKPLQALSVMLHLGEPEIDLLLTKVDRYFSVLDRRKRACIRFKDTHGPLSPAVFLSCFDATPTDHLVQEKDDNDSAVVPIHLAPELNKESFTSLARFLFEPLLKSERSCSPDFLVVLLESGVVPNQLLSLLIECWLNLEEGWSVWRLLCNLHAAVIFLSSQSADSPSVNAGYNEVSSWWSSVRSRLRCSSSVAAALTSAIVCRGASVTLIVGEQLEALKTNQTTKEEEAETAATAVSASANEIVCLSDWEGVHLDTEQWSLLVKQLEDLVSLATLVDAPIPEALSSGLTSATVLRPVLMTVEGFLDRGRGGISELVSQWLTRLNLPVLLAVLSSSTSSNGTDKGGDRVEECATNDSILEPQMDQLRGALDESRLNFPYSLRHDVLLANCSWEFAALWNADKEETKWLDGCLSCLAACSVDAPYRRGLASLLWHTFFAKYFEAAAQLVEKVGKAPKERLCRKSVGMSDTVLEKFLLCCERLLDTLIKVINLAPGVTYDSSPAMLAANATSSLSMSAVNFRCEDPWQDTTGPAPIVDVALETREPNENLIVRHRDLAIVLYAVFTFTLRSCKPLSLYDTRTKVLFFIDLSSAVNQARETPDLSIVNSRIQFLCRLISAVVQTIPVPSSSADCSTSSAQRPIMSEHANAVAWFGRALNLGSSWQLDTDQLRRHLVCELYSSGLDSMAEEVLPSVVNCEAMGSQLIMIAGRRICQALQTSTVVQKITLFSPAVTAWLKSLERDDLYCPADDERHSRSTEITVPLLTYIVNAIPEHQSEHKLALNLMEGLQQLLLVKYSTTEEPTTDR